MIDMDPLESHTKLDGELYRLISATKYSVLLAQASIIEIPL
jgi:hypothetical protein